jgi:single-strand DNA-binding protein
VAVSINKIILIGNLCSDVEIRTSADGQTFGGFYLATKDIWIDRSSGEPREKVDKHRVSIIDSKLANGIGSEAKKGALAYVEGTVQTKQLIDRHGVSRLVTEVVAGFRGKVQILAAGGSVGHINKVTLIGNMGKDPSIRKVGDKMFSDFSIATSESWKDKTSGEWVQKTEWHKVSIIISSLAEKIGRDGAKGRSVYVEGALETRKYTDSQGDEKYSTEIIVGFTGVTQFFDKKVDGGSSRANGLDSNMSSGNGAQRNQSAGLLSDEVPF